jgi:hypothetical protein
LREPVSYSAPTLALFIRTLATLLLAALAGLLLLLAGLLSAALLLLAGLLLPATLLLSALTGLLLLLTGFLLMVTLLATLVLIRHPIPSLRWCDTHMTTVRESAAFLLAPRLYLANFNPANLTRHIRAMRATVNVIDVFA